ncbi:hypothetical protein H9Q08_17490 [Chryseobacterium sp. PS-8]|uniref:Uncharacterized protein n=1 Tax=Chryseobacterium indicum TaxID=2766954 RepID=A0ABS9CBG6_9FLAO|nr:hypothetical protein [Chryseobacterium sp. PS-8]MCF2221083.1 hypothetical protein [Chryseobacterium sp. PS-8]
MVKKYENQTESIRNQQREDSILAAERAEEAATTRYKDSIEAATNAKIDSANIAVQNSISSNSDCEDKGISLNNIRFTSYTINGSLIQENISNYQYTNSGYILVNIDISSYCSSVNRIVRGTLYIKVQNPDGYALNYSGDFENQDGEYKTYSYKAEINSTDYDLSKSFKLYSTDITQRGKYEVKVWFAKDFVSKALFLGQETIEIY